MQMLPTSAVTPPTADSSRHSDRPTDRLSNTDCSSQWQKVLLMALGNLVVIKFNMPNTNYCYVSRFTLSNVTLCQWLCLVPLCLVRCMSSCFSVFNDWTPEKAEASLKCPIDKSAPFWWPTQHSLTGARQSSCAHLWRHQGIAFVRVICLCVHSFDAAGKWTQAQLWFSHNANFFLNKLNQMEWSRKNMKQNRLI